MAQIGINEESLENPLKNLQLDLAQNIYRIESPFSLERTASIKLAILLWQQDCIKDLIALSCVQEDAVYIFKNGLTCEKEVLRQISHFWLTKFCKERFATTARKIGREIIKYLTLYKRQRLNTITSVKIYLNNLCWTNQGTINTLKTAQRLVKDDNLQLRERCLIACENCLENEIDDLLIKYVKFNIYNFFIDFSEFGMMGFWAQRRRINFHDQIGKLIQSTPIHRFNSCLLLGPNIIHKEVRFQFLWNNRPSDREIIFLEFLNRPPKHSSLILFLFSKMNGSDVKDLSNRWVLHLLEVLTEDWRWQSLLIPTAKYVAHYNQNIYFWDALEIVLNNWKKHNLLSHEYFFIMEEFIIIFKRNSLKENYLSTCEKFLPSLFCLEDFTTIKLLLNNGTAQDKLNVLFANIGMELGYELIINSKLNLFNSFLREMTVTEEQRELFRKVFFKKKNFDICSSFILADEYQILDEVLNVFCVKEEISHFKRKLSYIYDGQIISYLKDVCCQDSQHLIDKFLIWCFDGNVEKIDNFKAVCSRGMIFYHFLVMDSI